MSTLKVDNIEARDNDGLPSNLLPVTASAWVNFNGTGSVVILDSHNVSSVTDNGTGEYRVNFANVFSNANYSKVASSGQSGVNRITSVRIATESNVEVHTRTLAGSATDDGSVNLVVFGGQ